MIDQEDDIEISDEDVERYLNEGAAAAMAGISKKRCPYQGFAGSLWKEGWESRFLLRC